MRSIRQYLTISLLIGFSALTALGGVALYAVVRRALLREFDEALASKARALAILAERENHGRIEFEFADEMIPDFQPGPTAEYFEIWLADGQVLEKSHSLGAAHLPRRAGHIDDPVTWDLALPDGRKGRAAGISFIPRADDERDEESRRAGRRSSSATEVTLVVARERANLDRTLNVLLTAIAVMIMLLASGATLLVRSTVRKGLRPLSDVANETARIMPENLRYRFPTDGMPKEVKPICQRLNDLLERLEKAFERERRFSADVAHELRTPIAELRSAAEVTLKWPEDKTLADRLLHQSLDIAQQMERLVVTLLAITRCETGRQSVVCEKIDLAETIRERFTTFEPLARSRGLSVSFDISDHLHVVSDRAMLNAIFNDLFANAVTYTSAEGAIACHARTDQEGILVTIENSNPGLSHQDLEHVFEPFWRKDTARSDPMHSGLGLASVAAFANKLQVKVSAALTPENLFEIRLRIPRSIRPA